MNRKIRYVGQKMKPSPVQASLRSILLFELLVLVVGYGGRWLDRLLASPAGDRPGMLLWLIAPMVIGFLLRTFFREGWTDIGWKPALRGNGLWYMIGLLMFPAAVLIVLVVGGIFGVVQVQFQHGEWELMLRLMLLALLPQLAQNIFEETGFRGYLTPKLLALGYRPLTTHLVTGLFWGLWHLPYLTVIMPYTSENLLTLAPRFLVGAIAISLLFGELRRRSGTIWPVVVAQTVGGALLTGLLSSDAIRVSPGAAACLMPTVEGFGMMFLFAVGGYFLLRARW